MSGIIKGVVSRSFSVTQMSASTVEHLKELRNDETAIKVENIWKKYGMQAPVLKDFNMTVPKGSIYALLGSSGCGKTTIFTCVVGRQKWDSGRISVLGNPSSNGQHAHVDCKRIGFMPQELALNGHLTIKETLLLYGRIYGMRTADIISRLTFLQEFLQLPEGDKTVVNLSGGQQRRASLAVALLHEPDLIILDEPTVGLDPLLRQSIWQYLQDLVTNLHVTIVLTTHYVDEARRSNVVGLMRHGRLIAEESPHELMTQYEPSSLDEIVLHICKRDEVSEKLTSNVGMTSNRKLISASKNVTIASKGKYDIARSESLVMSFEEGNIKPLNYRSTVEAGDCSKKRQLETLGFSTKQVIPNLPKTRLYFWLRKMKGLIWALFITAFRHPGFIAIGILTPPFSTILVQLVFKSDLHDLGFGFVAVEESSGYISSNMTKNSQEAHCLETKFGHLFLNKIPSESLYLIQFDTESQATKAVKAGNIWGFINIPVNYTEYMQERMLTRHFSDIETLNGSTIGIHLDMSNFLGSILIIQKLFQAFNEFLEEVAISCGLPSRELEIPLKYNAPVFGEVDGSYTTQVLSGLLLFTLFILPLSGCSTLVIQDRNAGVLDRMRVSGMTNWELVIAMIVAYGVVQLFGILVCTLLLVYGFSYVIKGPILLYVIIMVFNSLCGVASSFLLVQLCANEVQAIIAVFFCASFLILSCGAFWPIEGLQYHWRILAYCLPTTLTSQSFRSVVFRGVSYTHRLIWPGLVVPIVWIFGSLVIAFLLERRK